MFYMSNRLKFVKSIISLFCLDLLKSIKNATLADFERVLITRDELILLCLTNRFLSNLERRRNDYR